MPGYVLLAAVALLGVSCGADGPGGGESPGAHVTVLAAGSLTEAFGAVGEAFEAEHPGLRVTFSFGASSTLAQQALAGAPADVLATADELTMSRAVDGGAAADPAVFARNRPALLVAEGNPEGIRGLEDLGRPDVVLVVCAPEVPCGRLAAEVLAAAGVDATPRSYEETVKAVVSRVVLGEADAGIVYGTDARAAADRTDAVALPEGPMPTTRYPLAVLDQSDDPAAARAFADFVLGPTGQRILADHGFLAP